jgi:hypothetical protein
LEASLAEIGPLRGLEAGTAEFGEYVENQVEAGVGEDMPLEGFTGLAGGDCTPVLDGCGGINKYT